MLFEKYVGELMLGKPVYRNRAYQALLKMCINWFCTHDDTVQLVIKRKPIVTEFFYPFGNEQQ